MTDEEALFAQLEDVFAKVDAEDVTDLSTMSTQALLERFAECDEWIKSNHQVLRPKNQEGRDIHSERNAIQVVLHDRGVL